MKNLIKNLRTSTKDLNVKLSFFSLNKHDGIIKAQKDVSLIKEKCCP